MKNGHSGGNLWHPWRTLEPVHLEHIVGDHAMRTKKFLALEPRSSLQGGGNGSRTSLIELAEEFVDDEVDVVTSN
jgi:hypothetical protein